MNVGSLFSGIGGLDKGLSDAGHTHVFFCESDPWRRGILAHHWPGVPIHDDVRDVHRERLVSGRGAFPTDQSGGRPAEHATVDLLCGGFPCQDLSVAGKRAGLAGARSGLFHEFARIAGALRPRWLLVENVPGLLSSHGGRDFGELLGTLADIGYGVAWRTLDSRFFGVPQRRRRVFILAALADGDTRAAAERAGQVLAVGTRCTGHPQASGEAGEGAAWASADGADGSRVAGPLGTFTGGHKQDLDGNGAYVTSAVSAALTSGGSQQRYGDGSEETFVVAAPLSHGSNPNSNIAMQLTGGGGKPGEGYSAVRIIAPPLTASNDPSRSPQAQEVTRQYEAMAQATNTVRRLTPIECERLQALPDNWTNPDGKAPDSRRYAALGDAVTASVGYWLGRRLAEAT